MRRASQPLRLSLREALAGLEEQERHALLLCEIGGLTYQELADVLELSVAAVRSLLYRVRMELRATVLPPAGAPMSHSISKDRNDDA